MASTGIVERVAKRKGKIYIYIYFFFISDAFQSFYDFLVFCFPKKKKKNGQSVQDRQTDASYGGGGPPFFFFSEVALHPRLKSSVYLPKNNGFYFL